jgi:hypothetical protein
LNSGSFAGEADTLIFKPLCQLPKSTLIGIFLSFIFRLV